MHNSVLTVTFLRPNLVAVTTGMCVHADSSVGYNKLCEYSWCSGENTTINHEPQHRVFDSFVNGWRQRCEWRCVIAGVWLLVCDCWCVFAGVWLLVCDCWCVIAGVWLLVCDCWCVIAGVWLQVCDCRCVIAGVWLAGCRYEVQEIWALMGYYSYVAYSGYSLATFRDNLATHLQGSWIS